MDDEADFMPGYEDCQNQSMLLSKGKKGHMNAPFYHGTDKRKI